MLFDLRGRGRRRTVQVIYLGSPSSWAAASCCSASAAPRAAASRRDQGQRRARRAPATRSRSGSTRSRSACRPTRRTRAPGRARASALPGCRRPARLDQTTGAFTAKGKAQLRQAADAWKQLPGLNPKARRERVATQMVQAYGAAGLPTTRGGQGAGDRDRRDADATYRHVRAARRAGLRAGQTRKGDLAAEKASSSRRRTRRRPSAQPDSRRSRPGSVDRPPPAVAAGPAAGQPAATFRRLAPVAQLAEQRTLNPKVEGSIPSGGTSETALWRWFRRFTVRFPRVPGSCGQGLARARRARQRGIFVRAPADQDTKEPRP